jgi:predicted phosphodiesterase
MRPISEAEARYGLEYAREQGISVSAASVALGYGKNTIRDASYRYGLDLLLDLDRPRPPEVAASIPSEIADLQTPPFAVPVSPGVARDENGIRKGVILGDSHSLYLDERAEAVALQIIADFKPDVVVHNGDAVDCYTLSDFDKDPRRRDSLRGELLSTRAHLQRIASAAPQAERYLLEGNHEDRLRRVIWRSMGGIREVMSLDEVADVLNWPRLLHLDEIGFQWLDRQQQIRATIFPKFLNKHGTLVRKWSAYTARGEHEQYGVSGASGHTHRLGLYMQKDRNGNHMWWESGCLCKLDPDYVVEPNWQQGLLVAEFDLETGAPHISPVYIHNGMTIWRGRRYIA